MLEIKMIADKVPTGEHFLRHSAGHLATEHADTDIRGHSGIAISQALDRLPAPVALSGVVAGRSRRERDAASWKVEEDRSRLGRTPAPSAARPW
ncbi:hypothetical protein [Streptomyces sp. NPDC015350]|uniref:hypothetical protein n=1 Tax=Streptomyces sp. NPDC015350 TaxID=3364955 RepID=UPI0036F5EA24